MLATFDASGSASTRFRRASIAAACALAALVVYLADDNHVRSGDTFPARLLPISILEEGDLDFNEFSAQAPAGQRLEDGYMFNRVGDRIVSYYSIVPGLLNLPAHWVALRLGRDNRADVQTLARITSAWVAALSVFFMAWTLLALCRRTSTAVMFSALYAFGTTTWSVAATGLWQHGPSLLFLSAAFAGLVSSRRGALAFAGFMLGMAVWNRLPNAAYALAATGYVALQRPRDLPWLLAGAAWPALAMSIYSWTYWHSLLALGEGHRVAGFTGPLGPNLAGTLFSPNRGFFVFTPVFLLAVPTGVRVLAAPKRWPLWFALTLGSLGVLFVHALWSFWWGGECFGYRLLSEMVPAWILLLAVAFDDWIVRSRAALAAFAVLALLSVYVHFLGAVYYPSGWNGEPRSIDEDPGRAWDFRDTELGRLQRKFLERG